MSGFEDMLGGILGGQRQAQGQSSGGGSKAAAGMAAVAAPLLLKFLQGGGVQKLLAGLQSQGMGDKADSWVSGGENKAISAQELQQVVGAEEIDQIAQGTGASREQAAEMVAEALPQIVDRVSPEGQLPDQAALDSNLQQFFGQK